MAVVRSPDFLRALIRETALATLIHQRRLTQSCGGQAPTAERTVGPARIIAESLTPKPGIREQSVLISQKTSSRFMQSTWRAAWCCVSGYDAAKSLRSLPGFRRA